MSRGRLTSYGYRVTDNYPRSATYVDKILNGAKPGDLPVEQPVTLEPVVILKTAKALSLTIPKSDPTARRRPRQARARGIDRRGPGCGRVRVSRALKLTFRASP